MVPPDVQAELDALERSEHQARFERGGGDAMSAHTPGQTLCDVCAAACGETVFTLWFAPPKRDKFSTASTGCLELYKRFEKVEYAEETLSLLIETLAPGMTWWIQREEHDGEKWNYYTEKDGVIGGQLTAVPDLLAAAEQVIWKLSGTFSPRGDGSDCIPATVDRNDATVKMLAAAIARARGGE